MTAPGALRTLPYFPGPPERTFRMAPLRLEGDTIRGSMPSGDWNVGPDGRASAGSLGVLIDDVLGYLPAVYRPEARWAVSTQIHVDFTGPVPTDGSEISACGEMVSVDEVGGVTRGEVFDAAGRTIAVATQRIRFIAATPAAELLEARDACVPKPAHSAPGRLLELLGGQLRRHERGSELRVPLGPEVSNPLDMLHGGIGLCAMQLVGHDAVQHEERPLTTTSITASYLLPGPVTGEALFEATALHRSRSVGVSDVVLRAADGRPRYHAVVMSQAL